MSSHQKPERTKARKDTCNAEQGRQSPFHPDRYTSELQVLDALPDPQYPEHPAKRQRVDDSPFRVWVCTATLAALVTRLGVLWNCPFIGAAHYLADRSLAFHSPAGTSRPRMLCCVTAPACGGAAHGGGVQASPVVFATGAAPAQAEPPPQCSLGVNPRPKQEHASVLMVPLPKIPTTVELDNRNIIFELLKERTRHWSCPFSSKSRKVKRPCVRVLYCDACSCLGRGFMPNDMGYVS